MWFLLPKIMFGLWLDAFKVPTPTTPTPQEKK